ncbi:hypothetical protein Gohar_019179 [Gossypium harknessii]|uniref:Uncharacterized protein n=1 Tax=Gossypium harknessii TaxID=34285 RepID=A0A7J9GCP4_9ROSI|nr:hypothetical protein [Gossypium harknessii]
MGDLAKARVELEQLYLGIPDDSVNLTFQDLADMKQKASASDNKRSTSAMDPLQQDNTPTPKQLESSLTKLPSLDFSRGLQGTNHHHKHYVHDTDNFDSHMGMDHHRAWKDQSQRTSPRGHTEFRHGVSYDDVSVISMASNYPERGQRRRPGIPHSNICTICSTYIYIFRHRCLAMRMYWDGRNGRRQKVRSVFGKKIQPKVHKKSRKDGLLLEVPDHGEASRAEVGRERASEKRGESRWAQYRDPEHDVKVKKPSKDSNRDQDHDGYYY